MRVKQFKTIYTLNPEDDFLKDILTDLLIETRFCEWWEESNIEGTPEGQKVLKYPKLGHLYFNHLTLQTTDYKNIFIVTLLPIDNQTKEKLSTLNQAL